MVRASVFGAVDSGLVPNWVKPVGSKLVFTAFLHDAWLQMDSVENKPASLRVPLGNALKRDLRVEER